MLNFDKGFIDFNNRMTDELNRNDNEYAELCQAFNECKCLINDISKYLEDMKLHLDKYDSSDSIYEIENRCIYKKKVLEDKKMIEYCLKELSDYGFKVSGEPEYDERIKRFL